MVIRIMMLSSNEIALFGITRACVRGRHRLGWGWLGMYEGGGYTATS